MARQPAPLTERIERLSIPEPNSGCWLWLGQISWNGYAKIMMSKKESAHRVSWMAYRGDIPGDAHVLHRCDNRCCVNPEHLFLGTRSDNMFDMHRKGRHPKVRINGERHYKASITEEMVRIIRSTPRRTRGLAARLGTTSKNIHQIRSRLTWKHIGD